MIGPSAAGFIFDLRHSDLLTIAGTVVANLVAAAIAARIVKAAD